MESSSFIPADPERETWDAIVIGTGMGGSTAGYELAAAGRRVLFLEKGRFTFGDFDRGDGKLPFRPVDGPAQRLDNGLWPEPIVGETNFGKEEFFAPLGCGSGGTTGLYAAQLERFMPSDFHSREYFADVPDTTLPESWPIEYAEMLPHYRRAEALYRVSGTADPLDCDKQCSLRDPPPLGDRDREMEQSFRTLGLHPYRAHVGYEFVEGCEECGASLCPRACKSDAGRICLLPAIQRHGAKLLPDCEVYRLDADESSVRTVRCRWQGRELALRSRVVLLAAGAFMSPVLLLNSSSELWPEGLANRSGQVGRNLMVHASDFIAITPGKERAANGPRKALAFNDFYIDAGQKLGTFQSVGVEVTHGSVAYYLRNRLNYLPSWLRKLVDPFIRIIARIAAFPFRNAAVFASIIEDLPYAENRVLADPDAKNGMRFQYRYRPELRQRNEHFRARLRSTLKPRHRLFVLSGENNLNYGHVCGTVRFGSDPQTSVLDRDCRAHDVTNLYVVDASFFPSSGGTNPSLTIAANALRVAAAIDRALTREQAGKATASTGALADG